MSEETTTPEAAGEQKSSPAFAIKRIYLKDLSFETPMGIEAFNLQQPPKVDQELNIQVTKVDDTHSEVVLLLTITAKVEERTAFLIEVKQAGVFNITGLEDAQMAQMINSACPNILFPYARETIDSILTRGTFAALMLPPINFDAMFAQAVQQQQQQAAAGNAKADA